MSFYRPGLIVLLQHHLLSNAEPRSIVTNGSTTAPAPLLSRAANTNTRCLSTRLRSNLWACFMGSPSGGEIIRKSFRSTAIETCLLVATKPSFSLGGEVMEMRMSLRPQQSWLPLARRELRNQARKIASLRLARDCLLLRHLRSAH